MPPPRPNKNSCGASLKGTRRGKRIELVCDRPVKHAGKHLDAWEKIEWESR